MTKHEINTQDLRDELDKLLTGTLHHKKYCQTLARLILETVQSQGNLSNEDLIDTLDYKGRQKAIRTIIKRLMVLYRKLNREAEQNRLLAAERSPCHASNHFYPEEDFYDYEEILFNLTEEPQPSKEAKQALKLLEKHPVAKHCQVIDEIRFMHTDEDDASSAHGGATINYHIREVLKTLDYPRFKEKNLEHCS